MFQKRLYATGFVHREDSNYETTRFPEFDNRTSGDAAHGNKVFTYVFVGAGGVLGAVAAKSTLVTIAELMAPPGDVIAAGILEVDLSSIPEGIMMMMMYCVRCY